MANPFRTFTVSQLSMQLDSLFRGKILLLEFELRGQIEQPDLFLLFGDYFVEKRQMIAEENDARSVVDLRILSDVMLKKDRRHRRNIFMAEAQIGAGKARVSRFDCRHSNLALLIHHVARKNL